MKSHHQMLCCCVIKLNLRADSEEVVDQDMVVVDNVLNARSPADMCGLLTAEVLFFFISFKGFLWKQLNNIDYPSTVKGFTHA